MSEKGYILIVEDDSFLAEEIQSYLKELEYENTICHSGEKAIEICGSTWPDGILMDVQLAGNLDGVDTVREIRSIHNAPVIFLTANESDEVFRRCKAVPGSFMLPKPITFLQLKRTIEQVFEQDNSQSFHKVKRNENLSLNDSLFLKSETGKEAHHRIKLSGITHLISERAYCTIMLVEGESIIYSRPLNKVLDILSEKKGGEKFVRIHKSHAVNADFITGYEGNELIVKGNTRLSIGPSYRDNIKTLLS
ncbi:response regulator transcription factor [Roseivirga sp. BDSF3-8]|uniref:response regulator transcription factor n=1 Tax=Roseivirga sp. BDSF3-8 TaxID=3241598 RepID=UPI00353268A8